MGLLPSFVDTSTTTSTSTVMDIPTEYGIDFDTGQLTGEIVTGLAAIEVWIWLCIKTQRFNFPIYTWNYGADLDQYIGQTLTEEFVNTDMKDEIEKALLVNKYITGIDDFSATIDGAQLSISFVCHTKYGDTEVDTDV